jgi:hypothetical protein
MALTKVGINTLKDTAKTVLSESFAEPSAISGSVVGGVSLSAASTGSFGSIYTDKNVNASAFVGDGSSLTGIDIPTAAAISGSIVGGVSGSAASTGSFGRVEAAGDVELKAGNLIIGTGGKGIDFSAQTATSAEGATTTAEVLDHYEEGTWTAGYSGTDVSNLSNATGHYVKVGKIVHVDYYSAGGTFDNSAGSAVITGLPFTTMSPASSYTCFYQQQNAGAAGGGAVSDSANGGFFSINTTQMVFVKAGVAAAATYEDGADRYIMIAGWYNAA